MIRKALAAASQTLAVILTVNLSGTSIGAGFRAVRRKLTFRDLADRRAAFLRAVHRVEPIRRRNAAVSWRVFRDVAEEGRIVERFIIESWAEYTRLRTRMTVADRRELDSLEAYQRAGVPIRVSRLIGIARDDATSAPSESDSGVVGTA